MKQRRRRYTNDEITLCTYIARFGREEFDETNIQPISDRTIESVKRKVENIACMLDKDGFTTSESVKKTPVSPSRTNLRSKRGVVHMLAVVKQEEFLETCKEILNKRR